MTDIPKIGNIYAIKLPNGVYGACRLIELNVGNRFMIIDCFLDHLPNITEIASFGDMRRQGILPYEKWWFRESIPKSFLLVGNSRRSTDSEHCSLEGAVVLQSPERFVEYLFEKWRLRFDREQFLAELDRKTKQIKQKKDQKARERKKKLTLSVMAREKPFGHWADMWPKRVVCRVREIFSNATRELISLQASKDRKAKTRVLKSITDELNKLEKAEGCIETTEREEVIKRIEEMASLVRISNKDEKLTGHRDW